MILQGSPIDAGVFRSDVGEPRIEPRIMIAQRPVERTRRPDDLLYLPESFLGGFDLFYQRGSLLPADRGVPGDKSAVELVTVLNDGFELLLSGLAEVDESPVSGGNFSRPVVESLPIRTSPSVILR
jgi:hypothetical protein